jgi:Leucine-rich repeat (LRR) protein
MMSNRVSNLKAKSEKGQDERRAPSLSTQITFEHTITTIAREMLTLYFITGLVAFVDTSDARKYDLPRYAAKEGQGHVAPGLPHDTLEQLEERPTRASSTVLHRKHKVSKRSALVPRYPSATCGDKAPPPLPDEELDTLTALYRNMVGPDWHLKDGWMNGSNPCGSGGVNSTWYGVECTTFEMSPLMNFSSHVTGLALPQNNLVGKLPQLRGLQYLLHVDFSNPNSPEDSAGFSNSVGGTLDAFCGLGNLSTVLLANNTITGTIPDCIQSLANATMLDLNYNFIQGTTPNEMCTLHRLKELHLRANRLQGTVPECFGKKLTALRVLDYSSLDTDSDFRSQSLTGTLPASLCDLEHLERLMIQHTKGLYGILPGCLGAKQPRLQVLSLNVNNFQGILPPSICQATALEVLNVWENALTGTIPSCLGSLSQLIRLDLDKNQFHGSIPEKLCQASALNDLSLFENELTGILPSCLGSLSLLTGLGLSNNLFHGSIPEELCHASALEILYLSKNTLTGTLPSCLGSLSHLIDLELAFNQFHGPAPGELCQLSALQLLQLNGNLLTGSLPSCLAMSFLSLGSMLLHNNDFSGTLPSEWKLPSLMSVMLSNNPKLSGSMPSSLFLQQSASSVAESSGSLNLVLRYVVIEGTSIGGSLPAALCSAPWLKTLALSGNQLTGSLPDCIVSLQDLQTFRASNNYLTGTLPVAIDNMTSLTVLDLSSNQIEGRIPATLGDISPNLDTVQLKLNRLSCDLPGSVLDWQTSSANISFNLLSGNLFGCGTHTLSETFALSIQGAAGLRKANEQVFDAYNCGNSDYVLPVITIAVLAAPVVFGLAFLYCRGRLALNWRIALEWMVNPSTLINELDHADCQLRALALGVIAAAILAGSVALVLSLYVAKSVFECEFMATPTLANKNGSDEFVLSVGIGVGGCLGLVLGLTPWWNLLATKCTRVTNEYGELVKEQKRRYSLEEDAKAWDFDAERTAEATPFKVAESSLEAGIRVLKLVVLLMALVFLTIAPNVGYVYIVLSELTQQQKVASEMAVTLAKTSIGTLLIPRVARKAVDLLELNGALTFVRFRLRMVIATALSAITMIVIPVVIVLVTHTRCLYYTFKPLPAVDTVVPYQYCSHFDVATSICLAYSTSTVTSVFTPSFVYVGERCFSAVLSVYGPVFLGVVLLAATLPAGVETIIVPWLAPWCYRNAESSSIARAGLTFLRAVAWNVWPALANAGMLASNFTIGASRLDYLAQRVVERAFVQVLMTLLVALTFGIAMPVVGSACAVAAFVQLLHHRHVLGQIVTLGRLEQPAVVPNLMGCMDVPVGCAIIVVITVVLMWVCGAMGYLKPVVVALTLLIGLSVALGVCGFIARWRTSQSRKSRDEDQVESFVSSDTSRGVLLESLITNDERTESRSD